MPEASAAPCAPPAKATPEVSPAGKAEAPFVYPHWPFIQSGIETPAGRMPEMTTRLTVADRLGHWQMRWGLGRMRYRVAPGLYAIGTPTAAGPVLVTANYKMTVDLLRRELGGRDAWLLVLDTRGINVWCAAGKGTFGTVELIERVLATRLGEVVSHRMLILPQLGAPGMAAHEVTRGCGFRVSYGPVRAADLPAYLEAGLQATPAMRRVTFTTTERLVLTPVEITCMLQPIAWGIPLLLALAGIGPQIFSFSAALSRGGAAIAAGLSGLIVGAVLVPVLLPWLPGRMFAVKGAVLGVAVALAGIFLFGHRLGTLNSVALFFSLPAVAAWCAMNFTGSTTFTSPSGVEREMRRTIPFQVAALLAGGVVWISAAFFGGGGT